MYIMNKNKRVKVESLIHLRPLLLGDLPRKQADNIPEKLAVVDLSKKREFTYKEFDDRVDHCAIGLKKLGVKKGDVVCVASKNSFHLAEILFAIWRLRAIAFPMNWRLSKEEMIGVLKRFEPKYVAVQSQFEALREGYKEGIFVHLDGKKKGFTCYEDLINIKNFSKERAALLEEEDVRPTDEYEISTILLTGGTTGLPKGCALSHRAMLAGTISFATIVNGRDENQKFLISAPLFHGGGLILGFLPTFYGQGTNFLVEEGQTLKALLGYIQDKKITHVFLVPTMLNRLLLDIDLVKQYDITTLNTILDAGEPHDPQKRKESMEVMKANLFNVGGTQTEGGVTGRYINYADYSEAKYLECFGDKDPMWCQTDVFGENDEPLRDEEGEFVVRGETLMSFYWGDEEKTKKKIRKGWVRTEDLGVRFGDGRQEYTGRMSDLIISGGENIYASEVEWPLNAHPKVSESAVFGIKDEKWGERVCAAIVLREKGCISENELAEYLKTKIASYKVPKEIIFVEEIPKSGLGKTQRFRIKEEIMKARVSK